MKLGYRGLLHAGRACHPSSVALEFRLIDGRRILIVSTDAPSYEPHSVSTTVQRDWDVETDAEVYMVKLDKDRSMSKSVMCNGSRMSVGKTSMSFKETSEFTELAFRNGRAYAESGDGDLVSAEAARLMEIKTQ